MNKIFYELTPIKRRDTIRETNTNGYVKTASIISDL